MEYQDLSHSIAKVVSSKIKSKEIAFGFFIEEIEAASNGNSEAKNFANESGFLKAELEGALNNSFKEIDGVNGPQQILTNLTMGLNFPLDETIRLRISVVKLIMSEWLEEGDIEEGDLDDLFDPLNSVSELDYNKSESSDWCLKIIQWADFNSIREDILPRTTRELKKLKWLNLENSYLVDIPDEIGYLTELIGLDLSLNRIEHIPLSIFNLSKLKDLNLSSNLIKNIPIDICNLQALTSLSLSDNQLLSLPLEINQLINLEALEITNNKLSNLPTNLTALQKLERIYLAFNPLLEFPTQLFELEALEMVTLDRYSNFIDVDIGDLYIDWNTKEEPNVFKTYIPKPFPSCMEKTSSEVFSINKKFNAYFLKSSVTIREAEEYTDILFKAIRSMEGFLLGVSFPSELDVYTVTQFLDLLLKSKDDERAFEAIVDKLTSATNENRYEFTMYFIESLLVRALIHSYLNDKSYDVYELTSKITQKADQNIEERQMKIFVPRFNFDNS